MRSWKETNTLNDKELFNPRTKYLLKEVNEAKIAAFKSFPLSGKRHLKESDFKVIISPSHN